MVNLLPNLETFLAEIQSYIETSTEKDGKLILTLKHEIIANPNNLKAFYQFVGPIKKKLHLESYLEQTYITKPLHVQGLSYDLQTVERLQFQIDTTALHVDRLKDFFQLGTSKEDATESIAFLLKNGWTEKTFQSEIGLTRSTFFRYSPKKEPQAEVTVHPIPQNN